MLVPPRLVYNPRPFLPSNRQKLPAYYPPGTGADNKPGIETTTDLGRLNQDPTKAIYGARPGYEAGAPVVGEHGQPAAPHPPPSGAINMAYMENSYSNSNNGGSVNSQDSLWQVKAGTGDNRSYGNPDNRSYGNPDNRSYGNPDNRSYGNPDNRSYGNPDNRSYGNPDNRSYGQPEGRPFTYDPNTYDPAQANYLPDQPLGGYGDYGQYPPQGAYPADATYPTQDEYGRPYEADPYGAVGGRGRPHHAGVYLAPMPRGKGSYSRSSLGFFVVSIPVRFGNFAIVLFLFRGTIIQRVFEGLP